MLGLGDVKNVVVKIHIYVNFVQNLLSIFFVKRKDFAQTGSLLFDRHQRFLMYLQIEIVGSVDRCALDKDFNFQCWQHFCFMQSDLICLFG